MKKLLAIFSIAALLSACTEKARENRTTADQCLRAQLFQVCLQNAPKGPANTKYNDLDEVIAECNSAAYYMSMRSTLHVKPECRP